MSQTTVPANQSAAYAGLLADMTEKLSDSKVSAEASAEIPFGVMVAQGSTAEASILMASAASVPQGVVLHSHAYAKDTELGTTGLKPKAGLNVLRKGRVWVAVEGAVAVNGTAHVRHTANGAGKLQPGAFRADSDGVAEVQTATPTAANSTLYTLGVTIRGKTFTFTYTSDGSGTATEICDGFRTAMAADSEFTALIVGSGTATLILTGQTAGESFKVNSLGLGTVATVVTTPAAQTALKCRGCTFLTATTGAGFAIVEVDMLTERAARGLAGY